MAALGVKAGKIAKPYGLRGELQLILLPDTAENIEEGTFLFIEMDGQRVPFFIENIDLVANDQAIVKLEYIGDKDDASRVAGCDIWFDPRLRIRQASDKSGLLSLFGYVVIDEKNGELGTIKEVLSQSSNPLWLIQGRSGEILVPAVEEFVKLVDHKKQQLHLSLPAGLTEI
jgi:16S rRNA processing protein RimM